MNVLAKMKEKMSIVKNKRIKYSPFLSELSSDFTKNYLTKNQETKENDKKDKEKRKARRKRLFGILSFALNIAILGVILIVQLSKEDASSIYAPTIYWKYIAVLAAIVVGIMLLETLKLVILIKKSTKKFRPFLAYKTAALGRYYDNITPMSTGGQPFQMLYMNKRGIRGDIATGIPLMKYITWQISYVLVCTFVLIYNSVHYGSTAGAFATTIAWASVLINVILFSVIILLSVSKRVGPKLVIGVLKLLSKMHIVKNYQKSFRKVMRFVVNYQKTFKTLASNPLVLISEMLLACGDMFISNLIPYFVCRAFIPAATIQAQGITLFRTFIQSIICGLTLGFVPTPGAGGGAEAMFVIIFGTIFGDKTFWPVIMWRISTYYIYLLQGLLILVYDFAIGNKRNEKQRQAGMYDVEEAPKYTFREVLIKNRNTIKAVQSQEEDKLLKQTFSGIDSYENYETDEVIKNSDLVTNEELHEKVYPAEQMLLEMRLRDLNRQKKQKSKKIIKLPNTKKYKRIKR